MPVSPDLIDLRDTRDESLLEVLAGDLYAKSFPREDEREDVGEWRRLLWETVGDDDPLMHVLVLGERLHSAHPAIDGFVVAELYPNSRCGLVSYLAVDPGARRKGSGRRLVSAAVDALRRDCDPDGDALAAVFAEIHEPDAGTSPADDVMDPMERASFFARLGARRVPLHYHQPALRPESHPVPLALVALPLDGRASTIASSVVRAFLCDLHAALDALAATELHDMLTEISSQTRLRLQPLIPVKADPTFAFSEYSVVLHYATPPARDRLRELPPATAQFASFERDLLSYAYRRSVDAVAGLPPFRSTARHVPAPYRRLRMRFAPEVGFVSEGRACTLVEEPRKPLDVRIRASVTTFASGVSIYNLAITPNEAGESVALNEWDLVRLAKLWEGGEEVTGTWEADGSPGPGPPADGAATCVRFEDRDGNPLRLPELVMGVFPEAEDHCARAGTIQLVNTSDSEGLASWNAIASGMQALKGERAAATSAPRTDASPGDVLADADVSQAIKAICGLIQGILDFQEVDESEIAEVLDGVDLLDGELLTLSKGTLLLIGPGERALRVARHSFGASPYQILPHAVALHNEEVLRDALEATAAQGALSEESLQDMEDHKMKLRRALDLDYLPNVFHYPNEREIYERAHLSRGLRTQERDLRMQLAETEARYDIAVANHSRAADEAKKRADYIRNALLLLLGFPVYREALPVPDLAIIAVLFLIAFAFYPGNFDSAAVRASLSRTRA